MDKITPGLHDLAQLVPDIDIGVYDVLPGHLGEYLHDGVDEGGLVVFRGTVCVKCSYAADKKKSSGLKSGVLRGLMSSAQKKGKLSLHHSCAVLTI